MTVGVPQRSIGLLLEEGGLRAAEPAARAALVATHFPLNTVTDAEVLLHIYGIVAGGRLHVESPYMG